MTIEQRRLARTYLTYAFFSNLWFTGAVWLYFYRLFVSDQQVGVLDGIAFAIGLAAEVPSGALADKFGRDKLVRLGLVLTGLGMLIQIALPAYWAFVVGQSVLMVGVAFVSGADDALFYENLGFDPASHGWRKLVTRGSQIALIGAMIALVLGGWTQQIDARISWGMTALAFFASAAVIWRVRDARVRRTHTSVGAEIRHYLNDISIGFRLFWSPRLWFYAPLIVAVQGLFYATGYGLLRLVLLSRFHFSPLLGSVAVASCSVISIGLLHVMHKYSDEISERGMVLTVSLSAALGLVLSVSDLGYWGYVVILVLYAGERVLYPFMSDMLNRHSPSDQRATVLSVGSFLKSMPYVALAPVIGYTNTHGQLPVFLVGWAGVIVVAVAVYLFGSRPQPAETVVP